MVVYRLQSIHRNSTFEGSANFDIFPAALIENNIKSIIETPF